MEIEQLLNQIGNEEHKIFEFKNDKCIITFFTDIEHDRFYFNSSEEEYINYFNDVLQNLKDVSDYFKIEILNVDQKFRTIKYAMKKYDKLLIDEIDNYSNKKKIECCEKICDLWKKLLSNGIMCTDFATRNIAIDESEQLQFIDLDSFRKIKETDKNDNRNLSLVYIRCDLEKNFERYPKIRKKIYSKLKSINKEYLQIYLLLCQFFYKKKKLSQEIRRNSKKYYPKNPDKFKKKINLKLQMSYIPQFLGEEDGSPLFRGFYCIFTGKSCDSIPWILEITLSEINVCLKAFVSTENVEEFLKFFQNKQFIGSKDDINKEIEKEKIFHFKTGIAFLDCSENNELEFFSKTSDPNLLSSHIIFFKKTISSYETFDGLVTVLFSLDDSSILKKKLPVITTESPQLIHYNFAPVIGSNYYCPFEKECELQVKISDKTIINSEKEKKKRKRKESNSVEQNENHEKPKKKIKSKHTNQKE